MEKKIKILQATHDAKNGTPYSVGTVLDLGKERNTNAVNNGLAVWVDSTGFKEVREMENLKATEKKEGTPKKTTTSVKGKKIETK